MAWDNPYYLIRIIIVAVNIFNIKVTIFGFK